jgi:uncharacterized protein YjiK
MEGSTMRPTLKTAAFATALSVILAAASCAGDSGVLDGYRLKGQPVAIPGAQDASGAAFCPESGTLFVVLNGNTSLVEVTPAGEVKRVVRLDGFEDTEDVTYLGNGRFAVVEERRRNLCLFTLDPAAASVDYGAAEKTLVEKVPPDNSGLEGVAWDAAGKRFFIVKEKKPRRIFEVRLPEQPAAEALVSNPWDLEQKGLGMSDVSAVWYDERTGRLFILSDESKCVVECTTDGQEVSRLTFKAGQAGLDQDIPQPGGIAFDAQGRLYVVSEPNLLYTFERAVPAK